MCKQVGHSAKDCLKQSMVQPLGIRSAVIDNEEIQKISNTAREQAMLELNIIDVAESTSDNDKNENIKPENKDRMVDEILADDMPQYMYDLMCIHISNQLPKNIEGYDKD